MNQDHQIEPFAAARTANEFAAALLPLVKHKQLHAVARSPEFGTSLQKIAGIATSPPNDRDRLLAVALIARIGRIVKPVRSQMGKLLAAALAEPLPSLDLLDDPNDRFAVVSVWRAVRGEWWASYLATAAVEESNNAEKVRSECIEGLLGIARDLTSVTEQLQRAFLSLRFDTATPANSKARRFLRVMSTLRASYSKAPIEPGQDAGVALATMLIESFRADGPPTEPEIKCQVADETARLVHELARARFSLATDAKTYSAVDAVRSWYKPTEWAKVTAQSRAMTLLRSDISEALRLLVRAGITDDALFEKLVQAVGSPQAAREIARKIAEEVPGLPGHVQNWLLGTAPRRDSSLATESQQRSVDEIIADLLIDSVMLSEKAETAERDVLPEIMVVVPRLANSMVSLVRQCESTLQTLRYIAEKRSLRVRGKVGEEVDFSPLEHEMVGGPVPGVRRVRVVRPVVEAMSHDGVARIVRKGLVEPASPDIGSTFSNPGGH